MKLSDLRFLKVKVEKHPVTGIDLEFLNKQNAIAILLFNHDYSKVLLVNQYRPGVSSRIFEIPAGLIDPGENADETMYREVEEETGYSKDDLVDVYKYPRPLILSPGYTTERLSIYIARVKDGEIIPGEQKLDEGEELFCEWIDLDKVEETTIDFKTIFAINLYKNLKYEKKY